MRPILTVLALLCPLACPAGAETITGPAFAKDGDSLVVAGIEVRLARIDAPEWDQACTRDRQPYRCGQEATTFLRALIADRLVTCEGVMQDNGTVRDHYGRFLGRCWAAAVQLNAAMVKSGWAMAFRRYSLDYVAHEDRARRMRAGIWDRQFMPPWEWRAARKAPQ